MSTNVRPLLSLWTGSIRWRTRIPCRIIHQTKNQNSQEDGHISTEKSSFPRGKAWILPFNPWLHPISSVQMNFLLLKRTEATLCYLNIYSM